MSEFAPNAKIVHVDIDPAEISKIRIADVPIVGDAKDVIIDLTAAFTQLTATEKPDYRDWWNRLNLLRTQYPLGYTPTEDGLLAPQSSSSASAP